MGLNYLYTKFDTSFGSDSIMNIDDIKLHGIGVVASMDHRDNVYYAKSGILSELEWTTYPGFLGNEFKSNKVEFSFNKYTAMREKQDVLAARLYAGIGVGDLSFQQQFIVGQEDIRGYSQGKYRGDYLVAAQGEYRWNFHKKMSAVGFWELQQFMAVSMRTKMVNYYLVLVQGFVTTFFQNTT